MTSDKTVVEEMREALKPYVAALDRPSAAQAAATIAQRRVEELEGHIREALATIAAATDYGPLVPLLQLRLAAALQPKEGV